MRKVNGLFDVAWLLSSEKETVVPVEKACVMPMSPIVVLDCSDWSFYSSTKALFCWP